jgi:IPT/TIG domain
MHSRSGVAAVALAALTVVGLVPAAGAGSAAEPQPSIAAISPLAGRPSGGSSLTIRGTSLDRVTAVSFGGIRTTYITHSSAELISVTVPAHAVGVVRVRLVVHGAAGALS